jgi:RNA polymerase sigma factor (sigma-70 family)
MNRTQFEQAVEAQRPRLLKVAANLVGRDAEDVVQRAIEDAFAGGQWKRDVKDIEAWLTTAVQNTAQNALRTSTRALDHEAEYLDRNPPRVINEEDLVLKVDVERALSKLPEHARRAIWAVYVEGETWEAVGEELGRPFEALKKEVQRKWWPLLTQELMSRETPSAVSQGVQQDKEAGYAGC